MVRNVLKRITALSVSVFTLANMVTITSANQTNGVAAKLEWSDSYTDSEWKDVKTDKIYNDDSFEPGKEIVKYFKISNTGSKAFDYNLDFVNNSENGALADVVDVYFKNADETEMLKVGTLSEVFGDKYISIGSLLPSGKSIEGYTTEESVVAVSLKMQEDADPSYIGMSVSDFSVELTADTLEKFEIKFKNTDKYLYRVGNQNAVALSSLFEAVTNVDSSKVDVKIESLDSASDVSWNVTANASDWSKSEIQFSGTGPVAITVSEETSLPVTLNIEVVKATNITSATNVTDKDVVLLNDTSASSLEIKNGYTFYGNGFKVRFSGDGSYRSASVSYGFVTIENGGVLDNTQIICNIFPESYMYTSEMKAGSDGRYPYGYSAILISGNSTISNCYIYGARNNIQVGSGNVNIENTVTECGSLSNIHIRSSADYTVTLDNITTIQYQAKSTYDTSKNILGFGVIVGLDDSESNAKIKLKGDLKQYNWVTNADKNVSNTYAKTALNSALTVTDYKHTVNNENTVNLGIVFLNSKNADITDERVNKTELPYKLSNITMNGATGQVYSISGSNITADYRYNPQTDNVIPYVPSEQRYIAPVVEWAGKENSAVSIDKVFENESWFTKLTVDLDNIDGGSCNFLFNDLRIEKYGIELNFEVVDKNGNKVSKTTPVSLNQLYSESYTLQVTDNVFFNANGNRENRTEIYNCPFVLSATKTSIDPPKFSNAANATAIRLVDKAGGDWRPAYPVLDGITVTYWSASEKKVKTVDLSTIYNSGTISSNVWTYTCDDYTLTITGGQVHSDGTKITPVVSNKKLYFASTNKAFTTGTTSRSIILTYVFTDKNASTTWNRTETATYSALDEFDYSKFKNGTLEAPSSGGGGCFAEGTLITLADGTQKAVEDLTFDDQIRVWDFFNGEYSVTVPSLLLDDGEDEYEVITLKFDDSSSIRLIYEHGLFDVSSNDYVYINAENVADFVGHTFIKNNGLTNKTVKMTGYELTKETTGCYTILTAFHNNCIANGLLTVTPPPVDGWYDYFTIGEGMRYDEAAMAADIEKYGLYTYDDFSDYISYEEYLAFNGAYLKILVGKGYFIFDDILEQIGVFGVGASYEKDSEEEEVTTDVSGEAEMIDYPVAPLSDETSLPIRASITSLSNSIKAASYLVEVSGGTKTENGYICDSFSNEFKLAVSGEVTKGYVIITIDGKNYYTPQLVNGEYTVSIKNAKATEVTFTPVWGIYEGEIIANNEIGFGFYIESLEKTANGAEAVFVNATTENVKGNAFITVFNNERFVNCVVEEVTINANSEYTYSPVINIAEGYRVKAFILDDNANPLGNVIVK